MTPAQIVRRKRALARYFDKRGWNKHGLNFLPVAGKSYRRDIRQLQAHEWPKLATTGLADSRVLAVLFPPRPVSVGLRALRFATRELGVSEFPSGSNRGPVVDEFLAACGFYFHANQQGQPWCACFVTWCLRQAGWKEKGWNQAYVPSWVATAHHGQHGLRVIGASEVLAGDIACFDWEHNGVADHIGFTAGPVRGGEFPTYEGNTSAGNNSNGGQVQRRTRTIADVACFVRVS